MRSRPLHPAAYLFAFLMWIVVGVVALGGSEAHARALAGAGSVESVTSLVESWPRHLVVAADEPEAHEDLDGIEPADGGEVPFGWTPTGRCELPPRARPTTSLPAPESVILARLFEVALAARGPPRA